MRWLLLTLLVAVEAQAAPSYLALCHKDWNCNATVKLYKAQETIVTGWLEKTFAPDCKCADRLLSDPRDKVIRVHLVNSPCMRNRRCGRSEVLWSYNKVSASRAVQIPNSRLNRRFDAILHRAKQRLSGRDRLTCYVSPCLECDLDGRARRTLADRVSAALPNCILVDNPHGSRCLEGTVCESHGANPTAVAPCIVDMDGSDGRTIDVKEWSRRYQHCELQYYWEPYMNCIRGSFVNPRLRDCNYSSRYFVKTKEILCQYFSPLFGTC